MAIYEEAMQNFARELSEVLDKLHGKHIGFTLITFDYDDPNGATNYISNADREDMILALGELIKVLKDHKDMPSSVGETLQ